MRLRTVHKEKGAILVEAAFTLPIVLLLILVGNDFLRLSYEAAVSHLTVAHAARYSALGTFKKGMSRLESVRAEAVAYASRYGVDIEATQLGVCPFDPSKSDKMDCILKKSQSASGPGTWVMFELQRNISLPSMGGRVFSLTPHALSRNGFMWEYMEGSSPS